MKHVPQECQVHTCRETAVAYCERMYIFVCARHRDEFCIPDKHSLTGIEDGLIECIRDAQHNRRSSLNAAKKYRADEKKYARHLAMLSGDHRRDGRR